MIQIHLQKVLHSNNGDLNLNVEFELNDGELICLFGPSGAGKTSILKMISGLMKPDAGKIQIGENVFYDSELKISSPIQKRNIGFLFQDYALFPNMSILESFNYALGKNESKTIISETISLLGLKGLEHLKPNKLSGGQKQRAALGRSLVQKPQLLLLDEPLSALDGKMRIDMQDYLLKIKKELHQTMILVSHDISEIMKISDKVFKIENGKIEKSGTPNEIFLEKQISGKFQFHGEVVKIEKQDFLSILHVLIGNNIVKVVADEDQENFEIGDNVLIASKAFNPIVTKI